MGIEWIRPSVYVSYDVDFSDEGNALKYSNLSLEYIEETLEERVRGYAVIEKTKPWHSRIAQFFGVTNISLIKASGQYELEVALDETIMHAHGVTDYAALPYGHLPVDKAKVDNRKKEALIWHLQGQLLDNFEIDTIRAVIGDFRTAEDVQLREQGIINMIRERWQKPMGPPTLYGKILKVLIHTEELALFSPILIEAFETLKR